MPIYEYVCQACEAGFEKYHPRMDAPKPACPTCGKKRPVQRAIAGYSFIKDEATKMREMDPKYAKMVDAAWEKASRSDPLHGTRFSKYVDSGRRVQDLD